MTKRHQNPQIPLKELVNFNLYLHDNEIQTLYGDVPTKLLHPIQDEVNQEKVNFFKEHPEKLKQPLIISKDGAILDGHHRWVAAHELGEATIPCLVAVCPLPQLFKLAHEFEGSEIKSIREAVELMIRKILWHPDYTETEE